MGYIAVFGVSVLNGVVLVSSMLQAADEGLSLHESIIRGCEIRFRPIIVSAIVAIIGFLPAGLSHGIGAEIQRPLARVVIGGLISSTPLTLLVLPAIYELLSQNRERSGKKRRQNLSQSRTGAVSHYSVEFLCTYSACVVLWRHQSLVTFSLPWLWR